MVRGPPIRKVKVAKSNSVIVKTFDTILIYKTYVNKLLFDYIKIVIYNNNIKQYIYSLIHFLRCCGYACINIVLIS
jgi:hypothetical protein